jgi:hypothetical protein
VFEIILGLVIAAAGGAIVEAARWIFGKIQENTAGYTGPWKSVQSYGCWYLHQVSDDTFSGYYLKVSEQNDKDIAPIRLNLFRPSRILRSNSLALPARPDIPILDAARVPILMNSPVEGFPFSLRLIPCTPNNVEGVVIEQLGRPATPVSDGYFK